MSEEVTRAMEWTGARYADKPTVEVQHVDRGAAGAGVGDRVATLS